MLFECGFDKEAEKLRSAVAKQGRLAYELLPVALGRVKWLLDEDAELRKKAQKKLRAG